MVNTVGAVSIKSRGLLEATLQSLSTNVVKVSKYSDQILLYLLRSAPMDIQDEYPPPYSGNPLPTSCSSCRKNWSSSSLPTPNTTTSNSANSSRKVLTQQYLDIKSLIYDMGLLQTAKPLMLSWNLAKFYECLFYVVLNQQNFVQNACVRYAMIGIRRIIK